MKDFDTEMTANQSWEQTLDFLTSDMDPQEIDIVLLTERYRKYIQELQETDLQVSARAVRILSALLNMKAQTLQIEQQEESEEENPMDFDEEQIIEEEITEEEEPDLTVGPDLQMPVKKKQKRRVRMDELKNSLKDALEVKEKRQKREENREGIDQQFQVEEEDLQSKLNSLYGRIKNFVSSPSENLDFSRITKEDNKQERIEKFKHVLNLENDEKIELIQEDFLGNLKIKPTDESKQK